LALALGIAPGARAASQDEVRAAEAAHMRAEFARAGADADGRIAIANSEPSLRGYLRAADGNGDGSITLEEFTDFQLDAGGAGKTPLPENVTLIRDVPYAKTDHPRQRLDVYLPAKRVEGQRLPVVAYVHGGAWNMGSRVMARTSVAPLVASGDYAAVSLGYRLSWQATWPAQIHDLKAALRWVRAHADAYGFDPNRICAMGASAGGHLVAALGTTNGDASVEGTLGEHAGEPSDVQCVVDFFGPTDLTVPPPASRTAAAGGGPTSREQLLGGPVDTVPELARQASPLHHVDASAPPFLIIHGSADPLVALSESERLDAALRAAGVESYLVVVEGGGHGSLFPSEVDRRVRIFLDRVLRGVDEPVPTDQLMRAAVNGS
jgi:acetyl esterase/lipase